MVKKRVTLDDVAREAGVSSMTVSRVINDTGRISDATRAHVREIIARLDYRPSRAARTLVTNQTYMIAVVVPDITNPYFAEIVQGVEDVTWERDYSVLLANTRENPRREADVIDQLDDSTIDGLITCSSRLPDDELFALIAKQQAVVSVNRQVPEHLASVVRGWYQVGDRANRAARHLFASGRRRIGYLRLKRSASHATLDNFTAFTHTLGAEINPAWYLDCEPTWDAGYTQGQRLLAQAPEIDAIVGGNDLVALGAMRAISEAGKRIPDDIAITGGDDILLANQVDPPLTTFRAAKYEIGVTAARMLFERMAGDTSYREFIYDEELIVRGSAPA